MSVFTRTDDSFSKLCSALHREALALDGADEEIRAYGAPSECYDLVASSYASTVVDMLNDEGYTPETFDEELRKRTSEHCAHFNLGYLVQL